MSPHVTKWNNVVKNLQIAVRKCDHKDCQDKNKYHRVCWKKSGRQRLLWITHFELYTGFTKSQCLEAAFNRTTHISPDTFKGVYPLEYLQFATERHETFCERIKRIENNLNQDMNTKRDESLANGMDTTRVKSTNTTNSNASILPVTGPNTLTSFDNLFPAFGKTSLSLLEACDNVTNFDTTSANTFPYESDQDVPVLQSVVNDSLLFDESSLSVLEGWDNVANFDTTSANTMPFKSHQDVPILQSWGTGSDATFANSLVNSNDAPYPNLT
ncbi:hypothetical protein HDU76_006527 [Blyttiomyces sp. JEL0837]|nr:hypothetical protein HDU76_006527 [Blyttiomyces sp. JEL0837]